MEDPFSERRSFVSAEKLILVGERQAEKGAVAVENPLVVNWGLRNGKIGAPMGSENLRQGVEEHPEGLPIADGVVERASHKDTVNQIRHLNR